MAVTCMGLAKLQHQPGRDDHGHEEREHHRRRGIGGNGAHIGTHHARDEQHGQQGGDHGQGGDNGRVPDFADRIHCGAAAGAAVVHPPVTGDVLDHHDGVIHEDADGKDQCEQADAVQRVAHDTGRKECKQDGDRDHDQDHDRLAPADGDPDQCHDGQRRQAKVEQQFIGLFVGSLAVVTGDMDDDIPGDHVAFKTLDGMKDLFADGHGIGTGTLGNGQGHGRHARKARLGAVKLEDARLGGVGDKGHICHIADVDGAAVARGHQKVFDFGQVGQSPTGGQANLTPVFPHSPHRETAVRTLDLGGQRLQRQARLRQPFGVGADPDFFGGFTNDIGQADIGKRRDCHLNLARNAGQVCGGPAVGGLGARGECQHLDRHIVDAATDDQRFRNALWNAVQIGAYLFMDADDRGVRFRSDDEAGGHQHAVILRLGIDMLDAGDRLDDGFQRFGHKLDRILGPQAVSADMDIDHGHGNLRLFLARERDQGDDAQKHGRDQGKRGQRRGDERMGQRTGNTAFGRGDHGRITVSPLRRPDRISTIGPSGVATTGPGTTVTVRAAPPVPISTRSSPALRRIAACGTTSAARVPTLTWTRMRWPTNVPDRPSTATSTVTRPFSIRG